MAVVEACGAKSTHVATIGYSKLDDSYIEDDLEHLNVEFPRGDCSRGVLGLPQTDAAPPVVHQANRFPKLQRTLL